MPHEHHGDCCQPQEPHTHHAHEHIRASVGHICTATCVHRAEFLAPVPVGQMSGGSLEQIAGFSIGSETKKKKKTKRKKLGMFGLVAASAAA